MTTAVHDPVIPGMTDSYEETVSFKMSAGLRKRVERYRAELNREAGHQVFSLSYAFRNLIELGLHVCVAPKKRRNTKKKASNR